MRPKHRTNSNYYLWFELQMKLYETLTAQGIDWLLLHQSCLKIVRKCCSMKNTYYDKIQTQATTPFWFCSDRIQVLCMLPLNVILCGIKVTKKFMTKIWPTTSFSESWKVHSNKYNRLAVFLWQNCNLSSRNRTFSLILWMLCCNTKTHFLNVIEILLLTVCSC